VSAVAACLRRPAAAGYVPLFIHYLCIIYFFVIWYLQWQHAGSVLRQHDVGHNHLFIYVVLFSVYSGSMLKASCGSMIPTIIIYYLLFIIYLFII
jgi:hypothetical protein